MKVTRSVAKLRQEPGCVSVYKFAVHALYVQNLRAKQNGEWPIMANCCSICVSTHVVIDECSIPTCGVDKCIIIL